MPDSFVTLPQMTGCAMAALGSMTGLRCLHLKEQTVSDDVSPSSMVPFLHCLPLLFHPNQSVQGNPTSAVNAPRCSQML